MKTSTKRKIIIALTLYLTILLSPKENNKKDIVFNHTNNYEYVSLDDRNLIIVNADNLKVIQKDTNDIYVVDLREDGNSDFKVLESYKVKDKVEMEKIINILLEYENQHPTTWNRSFTSMINEWQIHNLCYFFGYDKDSTEHVDFDNQDESKYNSGILKRLLGN